MITEADTSRKYIIPKFIPQVGMTTRSANKKHSQMAGQAETGAELDALMPAVLDRAFKGEL